MKNETAVKINKTVYAITGIEIEALSIVYKLKKANTIKSLRVGKDSAYLVGKRGYMMYTTTDVTGKYKFVTTK